MLCRYCALMFEDIEGQVREAEEYPDGFSNHTSLEDLLHAAAESCYVCSNILDQLQDENAIEQLKAEMPPLLLRRGWRDHSTNEIGATILRNVPPDDVPVSVKRWEYRLFRPSVRDDQFGFKIEFAKYEPSAIHRLHKEIPSSTSSPKVAALGRFWYQDCVNNHHQCRDTQPWVSRGTAMSGGVRHGTSLPGGHSVWKWYPPRLLDISSDPIRLVLRHNLEQCPAFAALSHCWGPDGFLSLTTDNIQSFEKDGFDHTDMPENFRNVVDVCRQIGISYLWIDSLCLIQSGPLAQKDWTEHADCMQYVYSSCDLCISTAAADAATKSCFRERNSAMIAPVCIMIGDEPHLLIGMDHAMRGYRNAPIASRAWVLQERLLSRRILTFGPKQIFWECHETEGHNVCETFPQGLLPYGHARGPFSLPTVRQKDLTGPAFIEDQRTWLNLIDTYNECQLSRSHEDKLVAFAGIATHMASVFGGSPYIAGFFAFEIPAALLWHVRWKAQPVSRPMPPDDFYRAPSWSWAATDALIRCRQSRLDAAVAEPPDPVTYFTTLVEHHVELVDPTVPYGQLLNAALQLRAPLIPMTWNGPFPASLYDQDQLIFELPDIEYCDRGRLFYFDSQDDFNRTQEGVRFMPIIGFENSARVEGLTLRPTQYAASSSSESDDSSPMFYMRIGMAIIEGQEYLENVRKSRMEEIVLL
jgi:hypothetical protein